jgi:hypothetical protein
MRQALWACARAQDACLVFTGQTEGPPLWVSFATKEIP